jgi:hypothetical protein
MAASGKNPKKRNSLAGSKKGTSVSARRLQNSPAARAKKKKDDTAYGKSTKQKKDRAAHNKANRDSPNKKGQDKSRKKDGSFTNEAQSKNRARNGKRGSTKK